MNIAQASKHTGLPAKTIRYYEEIGFVAPQRASNGYRSFDETDLHKLTFVGRARALGFSIEDCRKLLGFSIDDCRTLLSLYEDHSRASADVKAVARENLRAIDAKIADLQSMRQTLSELIAQCAGDNRPDCPILRGLSPQGDSQ